MIRRIATALAAIVVAIGSAFVVSPAAADELAEEPLATVTDVPPLVGSESGTAESEIDASARPSEVAPANASPEEPAGEDHSVTDSGSEYPGDEPVIDPGGELEESYESPGIEVPAPVDSDVSGVSAPSVKLGGPNPGEVGYTSCWATEINRADVNQIDPFDMRTWPVYAARSVGTPGSIPHSGAPEEGTDVWEQIAAGDPRIDYSAGPTGWDMYAPNCYPITQAGPSYTVQTRVIDSDGATVAEASEYGPRDMTSNVDNWGMFRAEMDEGFVARSVFTITPPPATIVHDRQGTPTTYGIGNNVWQLAGASLNAFVDGPYQPPANPSIDCDVPIGTTVTRGDAGLTVTCDLSVAAPTVEWDDFLADIAERFGEGVMVPMTVDLGIEARYVDEARPELSGSWAPRELLRGPFISAEILPNRDWLPVAVDHRFRVKVAETLTVTPEGLLTGAEWKQGDVGTLDTYITELPEGGVLTPVGNLEFTSADVGDFEFTFFLEDPETGLRSEEALGQIDVYAELVEVIPASPQAPVVAATPESHLAATGTDAQPLALIAILLMGVGAIATVTRRARVRKAER